jgi:cobalamin biosynthesis Mg chelatase CobN
MINFRKIKAFIPIILVITVIQLLSISRSVGANSESSSQIPQAGQSAALYQAEEQTPTPTPSSIEFTQEEIEEGRPVGIIIGAVILVIIIFLGSLLTLYRANRKR